MSIDGQSDGGASVAKTQKDFGVGICGICVEDGPRSAGGSPRMAEALSVDAPEFVRAAVEHLDVKQCTFGWQVGGETRQNYHKKALPQETWIVMRRARVRRRVPSFARLPSSIFLHC